ncbi:MAG: hypothetical protein AMXMBFR34_45790 [Myxococcaceae bacterium]
MAGEALSEIAERQYGLITREQALKWFSSAAITRRLTSGAWVRVLSHVYRLAGVPVTWHQQAFAATLLAGQGSALSHHAAAFLFRLDGLSDRPPRPIDITVPRNRHLAAPGLKVHRYSKDLSFKFIRNLRVTSLTRTLIDLSAVVTPVDLEFALDSAQRRFPRLGEWLDRDLVSLPRCGPRAAGVLRELLALRADGHTDSPLEVLVRRALRQSDLPRPSLRYEVFDDAGSYVMRLDFCWPLHRVALHVDSYRWHFQRERFERDARQRSRLAALGWLSLSVTRQSLAHPHWLQDLAQTLAAREPQLRLAV